MVIEKWVFKTYSTLFSFSPLKEAWYVIWKNYLKNIYFVAIIEQGNEEEVENVKHLQIDRWRPGKKVIRKAHFSFQLKWAKNSRNQWIFQTNIVRDITLSTRGSVHTDWIYKLLVAGLRKERLWELPEVQFENPSHSMNITVSKEINPSLQIYQQKDTDYKKLEIAWISCDDEIIDLLIIYSY